MCKPNAKTILNRPIIIIISVCIYLCPSYMAKPWIYSMTTFWHCHFSRMFSVQCIVYVLYLTEGQFLCIVVLGYSGHGFLVHKVQFGDQTWGRTGPLGDHLNNPSISHATVKNRSFRKLNKTCPEKSNLIDHFIRRLDQTNKFLGNHFRTQQSDKSVNQPIG